MIKLSKICVKWTHSVAQNPTKALPFVSAVMPDARGRSENCIIKTPESTKAQFANLLPLRTSSHHFPPGALKFSLNHTPQQAWPAQAPHRLRRSSTLHGALTACVKPFLYLNFTTQSRAAPLPEWASFALLLLDRSNPTVAALRAVRAALALAARTPRKFLAEAETPVPAPEAGSLRRLLGFPLLPSTASPSLLCPTNEFSSGVTGVAAAVGAMPVSAAALLAPVRASIGDGREDTFLVPSSS
mmetsp:Transcript_47367/g.143415  ORF Transcript_47367/g.143415 Transcript_47367/m.143415 type:complete len:243 (+) Transcript_47367:149-877(+)